MQDVRIYEMEEFMSNLKMDVKLDFMKSFLRFTKDENYFEYDSEEEIAKKKDTWAVYAFDILKNGVKTPDGLLGANDGAKFLTLVEDFKTQYFDKYLLETKPTKLEELLKNAYLKYRLSDKFIANAVALNSNGWANHPEFENGCEEFKKTIYALFNELYDTDIEIEVLEKTIGFRKSITGFSDKNKIAMSNTHLEHVYIDYLRDGYDFKKIMDLLFEMSCAIELSKLEKIKRNAISEEAVIYTMEDYFESKALKGTKLGKAYSDLYNGIIKNKLITIHSNVEARFRIMDLARKLLNVEHKNMNIQIINAYKTIEENVSNMDHYYNDINYVAGSDEDELEQEALNKVYQLYVNGLKSMPKSNITNVTKYFAIHGNPLTYYDMQATLANLEIKILKAKTSDKKEALIKQKEEVEEVVNLITNLGYTYKIEKDLYKLVDSKKEGLSTEIIMEVAEHPEDFKNCIHRVVTAYHNINQLASSGKPSKVKSILVKKAFLEQVLDKCEELIAQINQGLECDDEKAIYLKKVTNRAKLVTLLQEITGRGILEIEQMLDECLVFKTPILTDLNPGFKKFAKAAIDCKGAKVL